MIEDSEKLEYQPKYDIDSYNFITAFKLIIYLALGMIVYSLVFGIIKGLLF